MQVQVRSWLKMLPKDVYRVRIFSRQDAADLVEHILVHVAIVLEMNKERLLTGDRTLETTVARAVCFYLLHKHVDLTYGDIARLLNTSKGFVHKKVGQIESYRKINIYRNIINTIEIVELSILKRNE